jgi:hypothetical protein
VTAKDTTGASGSATFSWTVNAAGSGEPPPSFSGNTSAIPAAHNVLEFSIVNQTNGQYPDSQVYWSFGGQTESIAQQPYIDMPTNSAGRMYFYLGTPNGPYYDFIEFTVGAVRRAEPARRRRDHGTAAEPGQFLPGRSGQLLRLVLAPERDQRQAVRVSLRR